MLYIGLHLPKIIWLIAPNHNSSLLKALYVVGYKPYEKGDTPTIR